nr:MAG TPA: hypothetical protein [Caudoviricetes sp.]
MGKVSHEILHEKLFILEREQHRLTKLFSCFTL